MDNALSYSVQATITKYPKIVPASMRNLLLTEYWNLLLKSGGNVTSEYFKIKPAADSVYNEALFLINGTFCLFSNRKVKRSSSNNFYKDNDPTHDGRALMT